MMVASGRSRQADEALSRKMAELEYYKARKEFERRALLFVLALSVLSAIIVTSYVLQESYKTLDFIPFASAAFGFWSATIGYVFGKRSRVKTEEFTGKSLNESMQLMRALDEAALARKEALYQSTEMSREIRALQQRLDEMRENGVAGGGS